LYTIRHTRKRVRDNPECASKESKEKGEKHMEIRDAVVIVTGASEGLGEACARLFTSQGARVALAARSHDKLNQIAKELSGSFAIPVDLRDSAAIEHMVAAVQDHYGRIDLLINNAGQGMHGFLEQVELAQYRSLMDLNLFAPLLTMQAVIPIMRKQGGGMILNVSAPLARMPFIPSLGAYGSTKAALTLITLTARAELAADNIRVGVVYPGMMATDMNRHLLPASAVQQATMAWEAGGELPAGAPQRESPAVVAASILEAVQEEKAEQYTLGFLAMAAWTSGGWSN
jgi:NAD(P)-dependent dehydrogenase (short-subunit alcohol dehydrogenase family)